MFSKTTTVLCILALLASPSLGMNKANKKVFIQCLNEMNYLSVDGTAIDNEKTFNGRIELKIGFYPFKGFSNAYLGVSYLPRTVLYGDNPIEYSYIQPFIGAEFYFLKKHAMFLFHVGIGGYRIAYKNSDYLGLQIQSTFGLGFNFSKNLWVVFESKIPYSKLDEFGIKGPDIEGEKRKIFIFDFGIGLRLVL